MGPASSSIQSLQTRFSNLSLNDSLQSKDPFPTENDVSMYFFKAMTTRIGKTIDVGEFEVSRKMILVFFNIIGAYKNNYDDNYIISKFGILREIIDEKKVCNLLKSYESQIAPPFFKLLIKYNELYGSSTVLSEKEQWQAACLSEFSNPFLNESMQLEGAVPSKKDLFPTETDLCDLIFNEFVIKARKAMNIGNLEVSRKVLLIYFNILKAHDDGYSNSYIVNKFTDLRLIVKEPHVFQFLEEFGTPPSSISDKLLMRYNQLHKFGVLKLSEDNRWQVACSIEKAIDDAPNMLQSTRIKRNDSSVPRSLLYDQLNKIFYIVLRAIPNWPTLCRISGYKKVTFAIQVPCNHSSPAEMVIQSVMRKGAQLEDHYQAMIREMELHKQFSGHEGIWPFLYYGTYAKITEDGNIINKIKAFTPYAALGDISSMKFCLTSCIHIAYQLSSGLHYLHTSGYLHGDLKTSNALCALCDDTDTWTAGLIDFGFTFKVDEANPLPFPLDEGFYGSIEPTAPELITNKQFTGDLFKVEIWALGYLFFHLFYKQLPDWSATALFMWDNRKVTDIDNFKLYMLAYIENTVEDRRAYLETKMNRSLVEDSELLIYDMMRVDPELRLDSAAVVQKMAALKQTSLYH